jgi:hypothetical protein
MNNNILQGQILFPFAQFSCLLPDDSDGRITRELWWRSQKVSLHQHHHSTMILHVHTSSGDEQ